MIWIIVLQSQGDSTPYVSAFRDEAAEAKAFHALLSANWPKNAPPMPADYSQAAKMFNRLQSYIRVYLR